MRIKLRPVTDLLLALGLVGTLLSSAVLAAAAPAGQHTTATTTAPVKKAPIASATKVSRYTPGMPASARDYYVTTWGVDQLSVKLAESGQLVRFSYRVMDATKASALNEKTASPALLDEKAHAVLQIPTMEKVGQLRQSGPPENGKSYWMVFSNKGNLVKPGHRVSVVVGQVRVDGLVVQ
jgi:hypothetical protein